MKYEIVNHGMEHSQYFQGISTIFSEFDNVVTGCGNNAAEAYADAVEQVYMSYDEADKLKLPKRPSGIRVRDKVPSKYEDFYWYVSIRY